MKKSKFLNFFKQQGERFKKVDRWFVFCFILIIVIGIVCLYSSSLVYSFNRKGDTYFYFKDQLIKGVIPSIGLFFLFSWLNYRKIVRKMTYIVFCIAAFCIMIVWINIPGLTFASGGARSWLNLFGFFTFQPIEVFKLAIIAFVALLLEKNKDRIRTKWGIFSCAIIVALSALFLILQPDLGGAIIVAVIVMTMYYFADIKLTHLFAFLGVLCILFFAFLQYDSHFGNGKRSIRFNTWLHPDNYSKTDELYQVNHGMIAVGTGGIFGRGIGNSVEKYSYMPEVIGDSIFAIIAEELGFILTVIAIIIPYVFLLWRMTIIAKKTPDLYGKYFVIGVTAWIGFQAFINIGAMIRLCPLTGVPLPFISYGSTSLWMLSTACGIVANISANSEQNINRKNLNM